MTLTSKKNNMASPNKNMIDGDYAQSFEGGTGGYKPYEMEGHELPGIKQRPAAPKMKAFGTKDSDMPDKVSTTPGMPYAEGGVGSSPAKLPSWLKNVATGGMYGLRKKIKAKKAAKAKAKAEAEAAAAEAAAAGGGGTGGDGAHTHGADGGVVDTAAGGGTAEIAAEAEVAAPGVPGGTGGIGGTAMAGTGLEGQEVPVDDAAVVPEEEEIV